MQIITQKSKLEEIHRKTGISFFPDGRIRDFSYKGLKILKKLGYRHIDKGEDSEGNFQMFVTKWQRN